MNGSSERGSNSIILSDVTLKSLITWNSSGPSPLFTKLLIIFPSESYTYNPLSLNISNTKIESRLNTTLDRCPGRCPVSESFKVITSTLWTFSVNGNALFKSTSTAFISLSDSLLFVQAQVSPVKTTTTKIFTIRDIFILLETV